MTTKTRTLLTAGVIAGPLFSLTVIVQELTREGFDGSPAGREPGDPY